MKRSLLVPFVGVLLFSARPRELAAQAEITPRTPAPVRAWAFLRVGGASSAPAAAVARGGGVLTSTSVGLAASHGMLLGMLRASDSFQFLNGPEIRDWALLAGVRSHGNRFFVAGAVGLAAVTPFATTDHGGGGPVGNQRAALAYDLSVHSDYRVAGLSLSTSGAYGPAKRSYVAASLGVEAGWFGR